MDILKRSIDIILQNQDKGGAYVANPAFPTYHYCWLRDGSFIAHAMDIVGKYESAEKFYRWIGTTIERYSNKVDVVEVQLKSGKAPDQQRILNTRFSLEGVEEDTEIRVDFWGDDIWALDAASLVIAEIFTSPIQKDERAVNAS